MELEEIRRKLKIFLENKTKTFIQVRAGEEKHVHNGFVKSLTDEIVLFDDKWNGVIPIELCDIIYTNFSRDIGERE